MRKNEYEINIYNNIIHIKNYVSIEDMGYKYMIINLEKAKVKISGENLIINKLDQYELCISGLCKNIELIYEQ